ncbi:MAG: DnaJ- protein scj1 [Vezdaea acicularis]|nr:MAG: DnaJ- protein scj1 [Vezdaea acicularis]
MASPGLGAVNTLLGIDRQADERHIKKAYRTLSKKYHPDKNPNNDSAAKKFVEIADAYDVLSTPETRRIYDQYGHDGVEQHRQRGGSAGQHHDPFDLFRQFFPGAGGGGHFQNGGQRRGPNQEVRVTIPLRDFYTGASREFSIEKQALCDECDGTGSEDGATEPCPSCAGRGVKLTKHMLAPGIFQQVQATCDQCSGSGHKILHPCPTCHGHKVLRKVFTHPLIIEPGVPKGHRLVFEGDADESPDWSPGDLIVHLDEHPPLSPASNPNEADRTDGAFFRRRGPHLLWTELLSLREAWMGDWSRNLTHLDGHIVPLRRPRGSTVQPRTLEVVKGEGMPAWEGAEQGDLLVEYLVVLPDQMDSGMEKEFWALWEKWRRKSGVHLGRDSGRPNGGAGEGGRDEL